MTRLSAVGLGILATLALSAPVDAPYRDGASGIFIVLSSISGVLVAAFCALLFWSPALLMRRWAFVLHRGVLVTVILLVLVSVPGTSTSQERIVNRRDADRFFGLTRTQWEAEVRQMVESQGWKVRPTPGDTGSSVMTMDPKTGVGLGVQPVFRDAQGPPVTLVVGNYYPAGTFRKLSEQAQRDLEAAVSTDLGAPYTISVSFSTLPLPPPGFDVVEVVITRTRR